jgi:hypothetical protein
METTVVKAGIVGCAALPVRQLRTERPPLLREAGLLSIWPGSEPQVRRTGTSGSFDFQFSGMRVTRASASVFPMLNWTAALTKK